MPRQPIDEFQFWFRPLIRSLMMKIGKDDTKCEQCGKKCKAVVHHPKYDGATLYDLQFLCQRCNTQQVNRYLK